MSRTLMLAIAFALAACGKRDEAAPPEPETFPVAQCAYVNTGEQRQRRTEECYPVGKNSCGGKRVITHHELAHTVSCTRTDWVEMRRETR